MTPLRADGLLHPLALLALGTLVLNDHLLKGTAPGLLTGKLSDLAGLVFFPLLLQALVEVLDRREPFRPRRSVLLGAALLSAMVFSAINLWPPAGDLYRWTLGTLQWPFHALQGGLGTPLRPTLHTVDPTDLLALPAVLLSLHIGWRRTAG